MDRISTKQLATLPIEFKLNGKTVVGRADETDHRDARKHHGIEIPHLCYMRGPAPRRQLPRLRGRDQGRARARAFLLPLSRRRAWKSPPTARARSLSQKMVLELLLSDMPETQLHARTPKLDRLGAEARASASRGSQARKQPKADVSHPAIAVNLDACIQCTRCLRACREEQVNDVIGYAFRGEHSKIVFDLDDPMGASTCVACGECVQACPTGALMPAREAGLEADGQDGRLGLPVLRRRLPAHLPRAGAATSSSSSPAATARRTTAACA